MSLKIGNIPGRESANSIFFGLKEGDVKDLVILHDINEIVSAEQVAIWDMNPALIWIVAEFDDPSRELGLKSAYRAFVPVLVTNEQGEKVQKIWSITRTMHAQLADIAEASGASIKGLVVRAKRTGAGLRTKYAITSTGRFAKSMPEGVMSSQDVIGAINVMDRDGIINYITSTSGLSYERFKDRVAAIEASRKANEASEQNAADADAGNPSGRGNRTSRKPGAVQVDDF